MKRTPWLITATNAVLLLLGAIVSYLKALPEDPTWSPAFATVAGWARAQSAGVVLAATLGVIAVQVLRESITVYQFRKDRVQRVLGRMVKELLQNDVKENRCTLFQAVRGWRAFCQLAWRAVWHQDDKWPILRQLIRINPLGYYLIVYARPAGAPNDRSCALFRVFRTKVGASEGVAGWVWESDEYAVRDVAEIAPAKLKKCKELGEYDPSDPIRQLAEATNVRSATQLRARERVARHYYGTVIATADGSRKWGVLLVDSFRAKCPFPPSTRRGDRGAIFSDSFRRYAETLSTMLT